MYGSEALKFGPQSASMLQMGPNEKAPKLTSTLSADEPEPPPPIFILFIPKPTDKIPWSPLLGFMAPSRGFLELCSNLPGLPATA